MGKINVDLEKGPPILLGASITVMVGSLVEGQADFVTVAAIGVAASRPPALSVALQPQRYSLKGIKENMVFSVNVPTTDLIKETDYCGLVSGAKADKARDCHFEVFYGKLNKAPFIAQCPINHACEVIEILNLGSHNFIIGRVIETQISEEYLTEGKADIRKLQPFFFASRRYLGLGDFIAESYHVGKEIHPFTEGV